MKLYLSGSIKHDPNYVEKFATWENTLREQGHDVVNPVTILAHQPHFEYHDFMREDIRELLDCEGIAFIPGWEQSTGARIELNVAIAIGAKVIFLET